MGFCPHGTYELPPSRTYAYGTSTHVPSEGVPFSSVTNGMSICAALVAGA